MPFTAIAITQGKRSGQAVTSATSDEANGNSVAIEGNEMLRIKNTGASSRTVTFNSIRLSDFGTDENESCVITAGATVLCGPFNVNRWRNASGKLELTYSAGTAAELSIEVLRGLFSSPDRLSI